MDTSPTKGRRLDPSSDPHQDGISNTRIDHNLTNNIYDEQSLRIQAWLSPLEPDIRHRAVNQRRMDGVGDWVLHRNEFESWYGNQHGSGDPTLLCYGGQGVGKTFISSLVIDSLHKRTGEENIVVLFLYCDYQTQKDQSAVNIIGSLLSQVALGARQIPSEIQRVFELAQRGRYALHLPDMLKLFIKTISSIEQVYICFDAMDELLPENRSELLRSLRQIIRDAPNVRLFLTGRLYIRGELDKYLTKGAYTIHIVADQEDIATYVSRKMEDDEDNGGPGLMPDDLKHEILKTELEKASDMFILVALNIDAILGETSLARRKKMLQMVATTGVDLDSVYTQTLQRIRAQKGDRSRLGMEVLMWISHAERPLTIDELCHALAIEVGSSDLNPENICPQDIVLRSCLGLVVVDKGASTVRLIHYTLQEYLRLPDSLPAAHQTLALTCLTYLNCDQVNELPAGKYPNLQDMPFLEYSSIYWGIHAKEGLSDGVKSLALELLSRYYTNISATLLFNKIQSYDYRFVATSLFTDLHCASYFGIVEIVEVLIQTKGRDINQGDSGGHSPLMWAISSESEGVVRLLLARDDLDPNKPRIHGITPLSWAIMQRHYGMARLLLTKSNVNPNKTDKYGRTPLALACRIPLVLASEDGCEEVVRLLLARDDINPDTQDNSGRTPLAEASMLGHEGMVKLLLARDDVNLHKPDNNGATSLSWACSRKHEGVVKLILARGYFNPDQPDKSDQRALWLACFNGNGEMVKQTLARDNVDPDERDNNDRTPLWWAAFRGYEEAVRQLLARSDLSPDTPGIEGRTPLAQACINGSDVIVKLLLGRDDVNPNNPESSGVTPLSCASMYGHAVVVGLLLGRDDVNPDRPDNEYRTPLLWASMAGHEAVVRLLLAREDVSPNNPDRDGLTPLSRASAFGYEGVVGLLLAKDGIEPDRPDRSGRTPLSFASSGGHEGVVRQLLARNDINPDRPDHKGATPLWQASNYKHAGIVRLLLARDDVNPIRADNQGQTPLQAAFLSGCRETVELFHSFTPTISSPN